jgi:UrcA family protein
MSIRFTKLLPLAAALAFSGLAAAHTGNQVPPSVVVRYGDLNLANSAGVIKLHARLKGAAKQVCSAIESSTLGLRERYDSCVSDALARGVRDVGNENLTTFHRFGKRGLVVASN